MRRKLSSFFSSSMMSSMPRLYLVSEASGAIVENTKLMSSPGRLPLASIRRSILLQVRHRVAADEAIDDKDRNLDRRCGDGIVAIERGLVLPEHLLLGRRRDFDVTILDGTQHLAAAHEAAAQLGEFADGLRG